MNSSRPKAAGARLPILATMLAIVAACGFAGAGPASAAVRQPAEVHLAARQARCLKASSRRTHGHPPRKAAGRRACRGQRVVSIGPAATTPSPDPAAPTATRRDGFFGASLSTPETAPDSQPPSGPPPSAGGETFRFFSPQSFWNAPLPDDAPLDPDSARLAGAFQEEVARESRAGSGPWINTTTYSVPLYTVPADQPTVQVKLVSPFLATALRSAWSAVPLPPEAEPASGSDGHLTVWQPSTDRLWEFWRLRNTTGGWEASWGGAMQNASSSPGVYDSGAWPGATSTWGASASSLPIAGGLITLSDLEAGRIDHALAVSLPQVRKGVFAAPAKRTDGNSPDPLSLPEGARLRLDPHLDLSTLHLPGLTWMIAEAAQRYGIVVRDRARNINFNAQVPRSLAGNPYAGSSGYLEGQSPLRLLASFPWSYLQVLKMDLYPYP